MRKREFERGGILPFIIGGIAMVLVVIFLMIPSMPETETDLTGTHYAEMVIQDHGTLQIELYADIAPLTVDNFMGLVEEGFYDGLTFHRAIEGFMIQGGDPEKTGAGGSGKVIKGEFKNNGFENDLSHTRGVLSMARRANHNDSASSQFFIVHQDAEVLDGNYAAFGKVTEGMEIIDALCAAAEPFDDNGSLGLGDQPVIESVRIVEK